MQPYTVFGIPFLYIYIPDACEVVLKPFAVFISGSVKKGEMYTIYALQGRLRAWLAIHVVLLPLIILCRCMHTHNTYILHYGAIYYKVILYLMYGHAFNSIAASYVKSMLHMHICALYARILTSNHFYATSGAHL